MPTAKLYRQVSLWIGAILIVSTLGFIGVTTFFAHAAPGIVVMPNTAAVAAQGAQVAGDPPAGQQIPLTLTLHSRNQAGLERFARDVSSPHANVYHHYLTPAAFAQNFGADPTALKQVEAFAQGAGLHVNKVLSGGLFVQVTGTTMQIETAFHTTLHTYHTTQGQAFYANAGNISLPQNIASSVTSVAGLENAPTHHRNSTAPRQTPQSKLTANPRATTACVQTVGTYSLTPPQLATAYNFPTTVNGSGQRLALVEFDGYSTSDVSTYIGCYAPGVNVNAVLTNQLVDLGGSLDAGSGAIEDELDIEVALGLAPGLAKVDVYEAPNSNQGSIDMMAAIASDDADGTISDSWGSCESDAGFAIAASEELAFLQMAAQGQGVYVAAGDDGAYDCLSDAGGVPYFHGQTAATDDPASDPYVTAVGGTNLQQNASTANYISETVWNNSADSSTSLNGGGGGISQFWAAPSWQSNAHATSSSGGISDPVGARAVPDITADADPNTGYAVYCTAGDTCASIGGGGGWLDVGGTSAATPLWAALAAAMNQLAGTRIGLITPALYGLYGADTAASAASGIALNGTTYYDYHTQKNGATVNSGAITLNDVTIGNNTFPSFPSGFNAQIGFDAASGLGSMQGQNIANFLAGEIRFTAPRFYMAAQGTNGGYWLSGYLTNTGDGNILPGGTQASNWIALGSQQFQGMPALVDNGITATTLDPTTSGLLWLTGVRADGVVLAGYWIPAKASFGGWAAVPGMSGGNLCKGSTAEAFAQKTLYVTCMTPSGSIILNAYNTDPASASKFTWSGWQTIGGGLNVSPTMTTDGTNLLIFAQTPNGKNAQDWYTIYTVSNGTHTLWHPFNTTCLQSPSVAFTGSNAYQISCIAGDTSTMWTNTFTSTTGGLSGWVNLGAPDSVGFHNATAISLDAQDSPTVLMFGGQGKDNAAYVMLVTSNPLYQQVAGTWQMASLPGIFSTNAAADYFGQ